MYFNFDIFSRIATQAYQEAKTPYSLQEVLDVFGYFFEAYEAQMRETHPPIRRDQIKRIIDLMPFYDGISSSGVDIAPEDYPILIDSYFRTPFRNCNYRINHFFSGDIRTMRMYEELY